MNRMKIKSVCVLWTAALFLGAAFSALAEPVWDAESLQYCATLPVQHEGRVKPLDTFARFTMLKINGKRSFTTPDGKRIKPTEWLMNCLLFPEETHTYQHFSVDTSEVIVAINVSVQSKKRARYSYQELLPGRQKLFELASHYVQIPVAERTFLQQQVVDLGDSLMLYEGLIHYFDGVRTQFRVSDGEYLKKAFPEKDGVALSVLLTRLPKVIAELSEAKSSMSEDALMTEVQAMRALMAQADAVVRRGAELALFPPDTDAEKEWWTPADILAATFDPDRAQTPALDLLRDVEQWVAKTNDPVAAKTALEKYHKAVVARTTERGEYKRIPLEVTFYRGKFMFRAQWLYVLSFVLVAISWLMPKGKWIHRIIPVAVLTPTIILSIGITLRCIIRGRPPVTTLYETLLFSTAVAVLTALVVELINRRRTAVSVGACMGALGMFIAYRYEAKEAVDTMPAVVAVLDTNFWLSTHVTTIIIGYAAGLVAAALAHVYIVGRWLGIRKNEPEFYAGLSRMIYGVIGFGLLFAVIGTVMGGVWANESWGRFWGWDPKENGALMIVLWGLIVMHARRGRYISDTGICVGAILLGMITAFSWWGVNLLGVGLHSYGFTSGVMNLLILFWVIEGLIALAGMLLRFRPAPAYVEK